MGLILILIDSFAICTAPLYSAVNSLTKKLGILIHCILRKIAQTKEHLYLFTFVSTNNVVPHVHQSTFSWTFQKVIFTSPENLLLCLWIVFPVIL